ncbi:MAG TPA: glycogen/starch/alpha-glucan phosphorylase [Planctomycetes bacterium]|nr:glycogen/starch/alpha-glucan phosphorylase [Planctomycetota bacterium]
MTHSPNPQRTHCLADDVAQHLRLSLAKDRVTATRHDRFLSLAMAVRDRLVDQWIDTQQSYYDTDTRRVYYLSLEFMTGRLLANSLINLDLYEEARQAMGDTGHDLASLLEQEPEPGLGNGGLGRLAACFLDSAATLELPVYGYGLRYEYGIFQQRIFDGFQVEAPDNWLRTGNPWEIPRPEKVYPVRFYGRVEEGADARGHLRFSWVGGEQVLAMAYDTPVPGFENGTVNTLRLWSAKSTREFNLEHFNYGDYEKAVEDKNRTETITRVLYPNDNFFVGRELRLKQQYFLVSATLQDALSRWFRKHRGLTGFADKHAFQLNDTHPSIAIAELMRILVDEASMRWEEAWGITVQCFGYTNHTILPEALEQWRVSLLEQVLPRHMQIIYEINRRFLNQVKIHRPGDVDLLRRTSLIEEGEEKRVRMAHLAIVGSHAVNGVAELHSRILREDLFRDFADLWPHKFRNKTNGITPRRWLRLCNPRLARLISEHIGDEWVRDLSALEALEPFAETADFRTAWRAVKHRNKVDLVEYITAQSHVPVNPDAMLDVQIKRIHEYKRQLLNLLHIIAQYRRIKADHTLDIVPRTVLFAGKAAPAYYTAKMIIKLMHAVGRLVNYDENVAGRLRVVFLPNYDVSQAERIIPAADLSEQISTTGMEASGTGNMKLSLNGALTIGTPDGANVEIAEAVGEENLFLFGPDVEQIRQRRAAGYDPITVYESNRELRAVIDFLASGALSPERPDLFTPIVESLLDHGDAFFVLADYDEYAAAQERVDAAWRDPEAWTRKSILNSARMGRFSSDRTVWEYAMDIWKVQPVTNQAMESAVAG